MMQDNHIFQGMRRDNHPIRQEKQFLWDAHNIRLTTRDDNTMLSITNERSTKPILTFEKDEQYIGHAVLGDYLVVLIKGETDDRIYRINLITEEKVILCRGIFNFDSSHPAQIITSYEAELVQKIYWVDGINSPRVLNIKKPELIGVEKSSDYSVIYTDAPFDFVQELELKENVTIDRLQSSQGIFPSGVLQYAFTYLHKYGQESNIFYTSELLYLSYSDRGGSPEDRISTSFRITIDNIDSKFQYVRVYSILRTSIDATPTVKRVTDISIGRGTKRIQLIDNNTTGDTVDPTYLLYVGGKGIKAGCIASKDNTLFLGNISYDRVPIYNVLEDNGHLDTILLTDDKSEVVAPYLKDVSLKTDERIIELDSNDDEFEYTNQLFTNTSTFKNEEIYRLGCRFQYKTGEWSEPVWIKDYYYKYANLGITKQSLNIGKIVATFPKSLKETLLENGYKRIQPLIVPPSYKDRRILAQGILCPTVGNVGNRVKGGGAWSQSSWLLRPWGHNKIESDYEGAVPACSHYQSLFFGNGRSVELQTMAKTLPHNYDQLSYYDMTDGAEALGYSPKDFYGAFIVDQSIVTMHSPDIEFGDISNLLDSGIEVTVETVGIVRFDTNKGEIDIQTLSPVIDPDTSGFIKRSISGDGERSLISGLFYEDSSVDDIDEGQKFVRTKAPKLWMTYLWHRSGSLNNDCIRPEGAGTRSAELKKKLISNLKISNTTIFNTPILYQRAKLVKVFNSNELSLIRLGRPYDNPSEEVTYMGNVDTLIPAYSKYEVMGGTESSITSIHNEDIGDFVEALKFPKDPIRMRYKSTPHAVINVGGIGLNPLSTEGSLYLAEIKQAPTLLYGGKDKEALKSNIWIPAGPSVYLDGSNEGTVDVDWIYGDTWFQRYDCLKTYPFSPDDINQLTEIGSFYCETRINIDGRYDRNRGIASFSLSPSNFNLINPVYSQLNNFFTIRMLDEDYYKVSDYPSQFLWTSTKIPAADTDLWTNLHTANSYDMDGSNGAVTSIQPYNDVLLGFQDRATSQILFNSRVQIQASDGVPIEIANSQKVEGVRVLSNSIGCQDKFNIGLSAMGVYFIDNNNSTVYIFNGELNNLGLQLGSMYWFRENFQDNKWMFRSNKGGNPGIRLYYDPKYQDMYFVPSLKPLVTAIEGSLEEQDILPINEALCYSEQLGQFTSMMSYNGGVMFPYSSKFYSLANNTNGELTLWENFAGNDYNNIYGTVRGFDFSFISNDNPTVTKIFDVIEMRSDSYEDGTLSGDNYSTKVQEGQPIDFIRVTNEYQDTDEVPFNAVSLRKKFRVWRALIPRKKGSRERIRNPWAKITLGMKNPDTKMTILHDLNVNYTV